MRDLKITEGAISGSRPERPQSIAWVEGPGKRQSVIRPEGPKEAHKE
jgi:hypothetical protein